MAEELVYDLWENLSSLTNRERYEYIVALAESIKEQGGKDFADDMIYILNEICAKYNVCPECGSELDIKKDCEIHTELDSNDREYIGYFYCPSCGWDNSKE